MNYPLLENAFIMALEDRGLTSGSTYSDRQSLELAQADLINTLITSPNITEGGYSVSLSDKKALLKLADSIYSKYSQINPAAPKATFLNLW